MLTGERSGVRGRRRSYGPVGAILIATILLAATACTDSGSASDHARSSGTPQTASQTPPSASAGKAPSGQPESGQPSQTPPPTKLERLVARLPRFAPSPKADPIHVTTGPTAPIYYRLPVTQPVAFLTMDDGIVQHADDLAVMKAAQIKFTMFLIGPVAAKNPRFFQQLESYGGVIEDHTLTHPSLRGQSYAFQQHQICGAKTMLSKAFGHSPSLFRPPFGYYDQTTLKVVHDCGLRAAFYWSETVRNGKVFYQTSVHKIRAGDIILMHFRDTFPQDVLAALTAIHKAGLTPALLTDYISPVAPSA